MGVSRTHLDARPVHLAAPDYEDTLRPAGDGVAEAVLKPHRLSQYWVRPSLYYIILLFVYAVFLLDLETYVKLMSKHHRNKTLAYSFTVSSNGIYL